MTKVIWLATAIDLFCKVGKLVLLLLADKVNERYCLKVTYVFSNLKSKILIAAVWSKKC